MNEESSEKYIILLRIRTFKGEELNLELKLRIINFSGQKVYSLVCYNLEQRIQIDLLKNENKLRQLMVGSTSHELRTPLNALMILMDLIKNDPKLNAELKTDYFEPALHCADYPMCLVNDILDFTKQDFDKEIRIVFEQCDIRKGLKIVEMMLKIRAQIRNINLIIEVD